MIQTPKYHKVPEGGLRPEDITFWEKNLDRVTSFVITNGTIQITLCAAYATALAFLVVFGERNEGGSHDAVFNLIIPGLSIVILSLSANVFSWINLQLTYLAIAGGHPSNLKIIVTYDDWKGMISADWKAISRINRNLWLFTKVIRFYIFLPLKMKNIYCYYVILYTISPILCIMYAPPVGSVILYICALILIQIFVLGLGLIDTFCMEYVKQNLVSRICR